jgi:hypothetical protein
MGRAGVESSIAEKCLAHLPGGVEGTYDRWSYLPERRAALEKLRALIERIINPTDNVLALRANRPTRAATKTGPRPKRGRMGAAEKLSWRGRHHRRASTRSALRFIRRPKKRRPFHDVSFEHPVDDGPPHA